MSERSEQAWVPAATYPAVYQAEMAAAQLEQAGIPTIVRGSHIGIFGPGFAGTTPHGVTLMVPADQLEEARELIE
jgi:hypothetical protein